MDEIYLDNAATTRVGKEVAAEAVEVMYQEYGNPSSLHGKGFAAQKRMDGARALLARQLGALPEEIVFTSGGTEANNLAILGGIETVKRQGNKIITTKVEHASVLEAFGYLREQGYTVVELDPLPNGNLNITQLLEEIDQETIFVSAMLVNSEIGSISAIGEAVRAAKEKQPNLLFHTDGVQGFGKIPIGVRQLGVDFMTLSGHKIHAPKGIGALYIKKGCRVLPRQLGGGQEGGLRSGTENLPGIAAFAKAAEIASRDFNENFAHVRGLCKYFMNKGEKAPGVRMNSTGEGTPYICNLSVPGYRSEVLLHYLEELGIYISSGSACAKGAKSHVLKALGLSNQRIDSALRISFSTENTTEEIDRFFAALQQGREQLIRS